MTQAEERERKADTTLQAIMSSLQTIQLGMTAAQASGTNKRGAETQAQPQPQGISAAEQTAIDQGMSMDKGKGKDTGAGYPQHKGKGDDRPTTRHAPW